MHENAEAREFVREVTNRFAEVAFAGNPPRHPKLAAEFALGFEEFDADGQARRRARALSMPAGPPPITAKRRGRCGLAPSTGNSRSRPARGLTMHETGASSRGQIDARLIARDAGIDQFGLIECGLGDDLGIGQKRPRHRNEIDAAVGQHRLRGRE